MLSTAINLKFLGSKPVSPRNTMSAFYRKKVSSLSNSYLGLYHFLFPQVIDISVPNEKKAALERVHTFHHLPSLI